MNTLQVGFSRVNITPRMGIFVRGYYKARYADGVLDDLELNVLALACGDSKVTKIPVPLTASVFLSVPACLPSASSFLLPIHIPAHSLSTHLPIHLKRNISSSFTAEWLMQPNSRWKI